MTQQKPQQTAAPQQAPQQQAQQQQDQQLQQALQQNAQGLAVAAQLGLELQRSGLDMSSFFKLAAIVQKYAPLLSQLGGLFNEIKDAFGQGGGAPPEGQAAPRR
jgi:hypothetical protein